VNKVVLTDANGRYEIADLAAGRYIVSTNKPNYVRAAYGERRPLGPAAPIDVAAGQVVTRIDFALQRTAAITGRVVDEVGDPTIGAFVVPMRYMYVNGERRMQSSGLGATTNDLGEYRIHGLVPGQYFVGTTFRATNYVDDPADRSAYLPTLYPGTADPSQAQRLTVQAGQTIAGINVMLLPVTGARISGVVLDVSGKPLATGGSLGAMNRRMPNASGGFTGIQQDGTFTLNAVPPGEYTLHVNGGMAPDAYADADVTVSGADVTDVQLAMVRLSTVRGRIMFDDRDRKLPKPSAVRVNAIHPSPSPVAMNPNPGGGLVKDDWTFELKTTAGRTIVRAGFVETTDWRVERVLAADGADVIDAGVDVPVNGTAEGITVVMTTRRNEITGTVADERGASVRDCVVVLFAQDPQRWTPGTRFVGVGQPDADNVFHIRVPAGDYFAVAFERPDTFGPSFNDPDILQQLREHAVPLSIGPTETKKLDLRLSAPPVY
jgi:protocatechuate 3,4-dioxygenase beta subunit